MPTPNSHRRRVLPPQPGPYADRVVFLADGALAGELGEPTRDRVLDAMKELDSMQEQGA